MATLLLRLDAPMQAWGTQSNFGHRDTGLEPSKSGIVGLIGAALGRPRNADFSDLATLKVGVRIDREGLLMRDYQTAGRDGYYQIGTGIERNNVIVSNRYYLADALFLVALEGELQLLQQVQIALQDPVYPLFLGRKAFPPSCPLWLEDGLWQDDLLTVLSSYPWLVANGSRPEQLRLVIEDPLGSVIRHDQPISFAERRFVTRHVRVDYLTFKEAES